MTVKDLALKDQVYQLVCFKLADEEYAVKITDIQEVVRIQGITFIPQVPDFTLGVVNLRGNVIPVLDLRKKLHLEERPFDDKTKIMVARVEGVVFGMVIDEILENIKLEGSQIDPAPAVKMKIERECVLGLGELDGRMIIILDLAKIHEGVRKEIGY